MRNYYAYLVNSGTTHGDTRIFQILNMVTKEFYANVDTSITGVRAASILTQLESIRTSEYFQRRNSGNYEIRNPGNEENRK